MSQVIVEGNIEYAIRRFKKAVDKSGVLREFRLRNEGFLSRKERRKIKDRKSLARKNRAKYKRERRGDGQDN